MAVPDNDSDLNQMPKAAVDVIKRILTSGEYATGRNFSLFTYEDGSMILYRYVKEDLHTDKVLLHTRKEVSSLVDTETGRKIPARKETRFEDFRMQTEYTVEIPAVPGIFKKYKWE